MWRRIQRLLGADLAADAEDELSHHIEMRTRQLEAAGMDPASARAEALRRFGDVERVRREVVEIDRAVKRRNAVGAALSALAQDVRIALHRLQQSAGSGRDLLDSRWCRRQRAAG